MKINFNDYNLSEFVVKEGLFCGFAAKLIIPSDICCKFTKKNKIFRSSVWSLDGYLLSAGFPKFVNWGENPENFPVPTDLKYCEICNKIDGSLMIVDYLDGQVSVRTRGVFNYSYLENAADFDFVLKKYPLVKSFIKEYHRFSLLFEIVTPNQRIILNYGPEPDIYLVGAIYKDNYELATQKLLDWMAIEMQVKRPAKYKFPSFEEMLKSVGENKEIEGVCVYSRGGQQIHKVKAAKYLYLHRLKSALSSFDKVMDVFIEQKCPGYDEFYNYILTTFDYEIAEFCKENIKKCCDLGAKAHEIFLDIAGFTRTLNFTNKKESALAIIAKYKNYGLDSFVFSIFNGKGIDDKQFKKLMEKLNKENDEKESFLKFAKENQELIETEEYLNDSGE